MNARFLPSLTPIHPLQRQKPLVSPQHRRVHDVMKTLRSKVSPQANIKFQSWNPYIYIYKGFDCFNFQNYCTTQA